MSIPIINIGQRELFKSSLNRGRCRLGGGTEPNIFKALLGYAIATPNLLFS
ncbi:hypothetical protein [Nostoc piscinale]|uniref:hypothetical protein n=1 Tax=Nostoc piscinale TaxID=224012 RepID=UPI0039A60473